MFEKLMSGIFDKRISKLEETAREQIKINSLHIEQTNHQIKFNQACIEQRDIQTKTNSGLIERINRLEQMSEKWR